MYRTVHPNHPGMHNNFYSDKYNYSKNDIKQRQVRLIKYNVITSLVGLAMFISSIVLMVWIEDEASSQSLKYRQKLNLIKELSYIGISQEENNNKLVHLTGKLFTNKMLEDGELKFSVNAVKLKRKVELYQWVESEIHTINHEVPEDSEDRIEISYAYDMEWRDTLIDSNGFSIKYGHANPKAFSIKTKVFSSPECQVGQFILSPGLMDKLDNYEPVDNLPEPLSNFILVDGYYYRLQDSTSDVSHPKVGDIRIQYFYAGKTGNNADTVSIIAKQHDLHLMPYEVSNGNQLELLYFGHISVQDMLLTHHNYSVLAFHLYRLSAWLLSVLGLTLLTALLNVISRKILIVKMLTTFGHYSLRIVLSTLIAFNIFSYHWFHFEPFISVILSLMSILPFILTFIRLRLRYDSRHRHV